MLFATAAFAVKRSHLSTNEIRRRWLDDPRVQLGSREDVPRGRFYSA
jgi:hypothetical protein